MGRKRGNGEYYVSNDDLLEQIILFRESGVISEKLGKMLLDIATNYTTKGNFSGYTWKKDMVGDAVLTCIKYLKNFNPEKSRNAFAYVTQICKNSFKAYIKEQKKHSDIKDKCYQGYDKLVADADIQYKQRAINYEILKG